MTYFYLFKTDKKMYAGQHRCPDNRDPMKDWYMGSGREWCDYLDENDWHHIKEFRKHVERIILEVIYDEDREKVGAAEKKWISYVKENYPNAICNISDGSKPNWEHQSVQDAKDAIRFSNRCYKTSSKGKETRKKYESSDKGKKIVEECNKRFEKAHPNYKKITTWGYRHNKPDPSIAKFPKTWSIEDINDYRSLWENKD